ncbi:MAG: DUF4105 domain-containing protein [Myxococcota bacterium]
MLLAFLLLAPRVDLMTMGPGDHPYERFGHAALVLAEDGRELVFNYGAADFDDPRFFVDFLRGRARFRVGTASVPWTLRAYRAKDRDIYRQRLRLSQRGARRLADRLQGDADPEIGGYTYHHFRDNCTTRVRDVIDDAVDGRLRRATAGRKAPQTLRDHLRGSLAGRIHLQLGAELLGRPLDERPDLWAAMYLPEILREQVTALAVGGPAERLHVRRAASPRAGDPRAAHRLIWAAAILAAMVLALLARRGARAERAAFVLAAALLLAPALALDLAALALRQPEVWWNENLVIFLPLDLALLLPPRIARRWARARVLGLALLALLHVAGVARQDAAASAAFALGCLAPLRVAYGGAAIDSTNRRTRST